MKRIISLTLMLVLILGATASFGQGTLEVEGKATLEVSPDVAYVNIGVETEADTSIEAQKDNKIKMNKVIKKLSELEISEDQIKTSNYSLYQRTRYIKDKENEVYYQVRNILKVTIHDLDKVGKVVDTGGNIVHSVKFGLKDDSKYYNEALQLAMKDAHKKAQMIASIFGVELDKPKEVKELSNSSTGVLRQPQVNMSKAESTSTPIQSGDTTVEAKLKVIYGY